MEFWKEKDFWFCCAEVWGVICPATTSGNVLNELHEGKPGGRILSVRHLVRECGPNRNKRSQRLERIESQTNEYLPPSWFIAQSALSPNGFVSIEPLFLSNYIQYRQFINIFSFLFLKNNFFLLCKKYSK